ncbi:AAA family ATPase [Viridibacillus arvi]|uniref:AAA family ATPase n=1 Tax=Viridibacillus arvi TaxID=263475 RepID=UPI00247FE2F3|nr:AAA family ATPase [Viridibacillus arvi]
MENYLKKTVGNYSLGMKQHLLLAMAIINQPKLLFLDEPLNGLDPSSAILMRKILLELANQGTTIILSSHNLSEIDRVTKQILFLKEGQIIEEDMSQHETIYYHFIVSDLVRAVKLLTAEAYQIGQTEHGFKVKLGSHLLQHLLDLLKEDEIVILDVQKEIVGSEKRYEEIFEV